ncbi:hypothetical protein Tco_0441184 [Tanacetum coccineum]
MILRRPPPLGVSRGPSVKHGAVVGDCTMAHVGPDDVLPRLTSEQVKATMPDPKSRSKGKDISSLAPQSRDSSRTPGARKDVSKKRKLAANDELSKSPSSHSQQEKGDASIDAAEDVARSPDVASPRGDQLTEVLSDGYGSEGLGVTKIPLQVAGKGTSKQVDGTSRGGSRPSPSMLFEPEWKISSHDRYNTNSICRDMLLHLSTPAERDYQRNFSHEDAIRRGFTKLGMAMSAVTDLLDRDEDLLASHEKLKGKYEELQGKHDKLLAKHDGLYGRHQEKKKEH